MWGKDSVREALVETLGFLSEDEFSFDFLQATMSTGLQPYLGFSDPSAQAISPNEVILFSGGLDSLAGTVDELIGNNKKVALVSHQSSTTVAAKQNGLVNTLRERLNGRQLFYVPVTINKGQEEALFENGIISFNFPISEHVLGTRASRTTHPRVLADCSRLFSQILSDNISIQNPYLWKTKSEVVQVLADRGCADLISQTLSCTRVREATKIRHHCGTCSQCVDPRFGILAADLAEYEPVDNYAIDLFKGQHGPGPDLTCWP